MTWKPETFNVSPSFADYLKAGKLLWSNCTSKKQYSIYYLPRNAIVELKAKVLGESYYVKQFRYKFFLIRACKVNSTWWNLNQWCRRN